MAALGGVKAALDEAIAERGEVEPQRRLFEPEQEARLPEVGARKVGRPVGARNRRTEEYARFLRARFGDPLAVGTSIAARDITQPGKLDELASDLGMKRGDAAEFWLRTLNAVLPYLHQRMPQAVVLNPGAPGGDRIELELVDDVFLPVYDDEEAA